MTYSIFHSTRALQNFLEVLAALALIAAWVLPRAGSRWHRLFEERFARLAADRSKAIATAALVPMLARLLLLPVFPIPQPRVHDEFSYLLLGDTLAHGRLSNPAPPEWRHFETEYEIVRPTYASQYQPAQGIALAAGEAILKNPWWGVWLTTGLMCGALCWALGFVVPPRWALWGALLAALQFGIFGYWMNSYFGGAVPALGGALIFGGITRRPAVSSSLIAAAGLLVVLASRPAEGILWFAVAAVISVRRRIPLAAASAALALLLAGCGVLAFYNARVTGNPLESPYALYRADYGTPQSYWWQPAVVVNHFDNPELAANYRDQLNYWERRYSPAALWDATWHRLRDFWRFFIGPFLTPAVLFAALALRRLRSWLWVSGLFILDHATYHAWYPQQSASETILIVLILVEGWRQLRIWRARAGTGRAISRNLALGFCAAVAVLSVGLVFQPSSRIWDTMSNPPNARDLAVRRLEHAPGKHLVFVRYGAHHPWYDEWVFNGADLKGSKIVFARMCSPDSDLALARHARPRCVDCEPRRRSAGCARDAGGIAAGFRATLIGAINYLTK
jgi:hypothetical protein